MNESIARELRGFGPAGIAAILIILLAGNHGLVPLGAILVLVWARWSGTPWREIGFVRPRNWVVSLLLGTLFGIGLKFLMKAVVMPLLGADPVNQAYHYLAGNSAALPGAIWTMIVVAGFGEETVFRGYLFERSRKLFGPSLLATSFTVLVTALWFGAGHYANQGFSGAEQAAIVGLIYGSMFALTGKILLVMCTHAAFDLTALAMIYWDVEAKIAHLVW